MGLDAAVRSGQFHEDPPLHPALLIRRDHLPTPIAQTLGPTGARECLPPHN
jgi:hypothetical protein